MPLRLYLLRNAETDYCRTGRYCSRDGVSLTEQGQQMASFFAKTYGDIDWQACFCSPLKHAVETVRPLCNAHSLEVNIRDGLRELSFGKWEGMSPATVNVSFHDDYIRWLADPAWNRPTQGEKGFVQPAVVRMCWPKSKKPTAMAMCWSFPTRPPCGLCCVPCWGWMLAATATGWPCPSPLFPVWTCWSTAPLCGGLMTVLTYPPTCVAPGLAMGRMARTKRHKFCNDHKQGSGEPGGQGARRVA
jgi:hypothetical protein